MPQAKLVLRQGGHLRRVTAGSVNSTLHILLHRANRLRGYAQRSRAVILRVDRERVGTALFRVRRPNNVRPVLLRVHGQRGTEARIAAGPVKFVHIPGHLTQGLVQGRRVEPWGRRRSRGTFGQWLLLRLLGRGLTRHRRVAHDGQELVASGHLLLQLIQLHQPVFHV